MASAADSDGLYSHSKLRAFFERINLPQKWHHMSIDAVGPNTVERLEYLTVLYRFTICAIPLENLSLHYSKHHLIDLHPELIFNKIVQNCNRRGGLCYEICILFVTVLKSIGFEAYLTGAKILDNNRGWTPWEHTVVIVTIDDTKLCADVSMGTASCSQPMPMVAGCEESIVCDGVPTTSLRLVYRKMSQSAATSPPLWICEVRWHESLPWREFFCFNEVEYTHGDLKMIDHWVRTSPTHWATYRIVLVLPVMSDDGEKLSGAIQLGGSKIRRRVGSHSQLLEAEFKSDDARCAALDRHLGIKISPEEKCGIRSTVTALDAFWADE